MTNTREIVEHDVRGPLNARLQPPQQRIHKAHGEWATRCEYRGFQTRRRSSALEGRQSPMEQSDILLVTAMSKRPIRFLRGVVIVASVQGVPHDDSLEEVTAKMRAMMICLKTAPWDRPGTFAGQSTADADGRSGAQRRAL